MTTETDVKQRLAALNAVLAAATVECPDCKGGKGWVNAADGEWDDCETCKYAGRVARFPGFRQECETCLGDGVYTTGRDEELYRCPGCGEPGWQVRAGGLAAGLEGLTVDQALGWLTEFEIWMEDLYADDPMPTEAEIDEAGLRLVCQVVGLEVPK